MYKKYSNYKNYKKLWLLERNLFSNGEKEGIIKKIYKGMEGYYERSYEY